MSLPNELLPVGLLATPAAAGGPYTIERSLRFNSADSAYLSRTPASAGNQKTWTFSFWAKFCSLANSQFILRCAFSTTHLNLILNTNGTLQLSDYNNSILVSSQVFRDFSAWYHIVIRVDTTLATADDRVRIYVNGTQVTQFSTRNNPTQNADLAVNAAQQHFISHSEGYLNAYLADVHFVDGSALDPTSFGEFDANNVWQPLSEVSVDYGTNGFHLLFSDNSTAAALGKDTSGKNNTWTVNNISVAAGSGNDSLKDVPVNGTETDTGAGGEVRGNYATWNPLNGSPSYTYTNGNLDLSFDAVNDSHATTTIAVKSGVWYCEGVLTAHGGSTVAGGFCVLDGSLQWNNANASSSGRIEYRLSGAIIYNGSSAATVASYGVGDIIGIWIDATNNQIKLYKNNTLQYTGSSLTFGSYMPGYYGNGGASRTMSATINAGQRAFSYTAPSSAKALCTANLPTPTIANGADYFDINLWTGDGASRSFSSFNFSPDFVWLKCRNFTHEHMLFDTIRGPLNRLCSSVPNFEATQANTLTSFDANGFSLGSDSQVNQSTRPYVGWSWDAGSSTVTNNDGSITSSVRANASAGFSVVTFTGPASAGFNSVGHGLGAEPYLILCKDRTNARNWGVYHKSVITGDYQVLVLNENLAVFNSATPTWDVSEINSTIFTPYFRDDFGASYNANNVAYCFAPVAGYSAFGSYVGNGSDDGPFVYTGHRSRFILIKSTTLAANWVILDTERNPYNIVNQVEARPDTNATPSADPVVDIVSNGFKIRKGTASVFNSSSDTYLWAAFAESPFQYSRAR